MGIAELLKLEKTDRKAYEESLKKHRDLKNAMDSQKKIGYDEGRIEEKHRTAISLYSEGFDMRIISKVTGLNKNELIELFRKEGLS